MIAFAIFLLAQAAPAASLAKNADLSASVADTSYVLGPDDQIEITVFGQKDMSFKTRIRADGSIIAPFLGPVQVSGKTTAQVSRDLGQAYLRGGYLSKPSLNVEVTEYASKVAEVSGWVDKAGLYPLDRSYTVADLVARAGGVARANGAREGGADTVVLKPAAGGPDVRIALNDQTASRRPVLPGDRLYVPAAEKLYVYGEVNKGGGFDYRSGMTYRQALALAGGPTVAGSTRRIEVRRSGQQVKAMLDDVAHPEDVLVIKEKRF